MSQPPSFGTPPPATYGFAPVSRRTNGLAITSLILGILFCIPWITGLLAVVFGILGIRKTRDPQVGGKGIAVAGLVLGIVSFIGWSLWGTVVVGFFVQASAPQRAMAKQFLADLADQDIPAAHSMVSASLSPDEVQALGDKIKPWGALVDTTNSSVNMSNVNGMKHMTLGGVAHFAQGSHAYVISFTQENGEWKIEKVEFP